MLEILHQVLLNVLGRQSTSFWRLILEKSCYTLGHVGLVRTEGVWEVRWVEMGLDVFSVLVPGQAGTNSQLPTLLAH